MKIKILTLLKSILSGAFCFLTMTMLTSCGWFGPDFFLVLENTKGVVQGTPVLWSGSEIGEVSSVKMSNGRFCVTVKLHSDCHGQLRSDIRAQIFGRSIINATPYIQLCQGADPNALPLKRGSQVEVVTALIPSVDLDTPTLKVAEKISEAGKKIKEVVTDPETRKQVQKSLEGAGNEIRNPNAPTPDQKQQDPKNDAFQ